MLEDRAQRLEGTSRVERRRGQRQQQPADTDQRYRVTQPQRLGRSRSELRPDEGQIRDDPHERELPVARNHVGGVLDDVAQQNLGFCLPLYIDMIPVLSCLYITEGKIRDFWDSISN